MSENKIPQGSNNAGNVIGWLKDISDFVEKTGLQKLIIIFILLIIVALFGVFCYNPKSVINYIDQEREKIHTEAVKRRFAVEPQIHEILLNLRMDLSADRTFILETHNGGENLAGLPFLYVDLTYAEPRNTMAWLESEYKNVRLSRHPWALEVYNETLWLGPIDNFKESDTELYLRLSKEGAKYLACIVLYGDYAPSGVLGIVYSDITRIPEEIEIRRVLHRYSASLSPLLMKTGKLK